MEARITCECGDVTDIENRQEFINWAMDINAHGIHYPAQRSCKFTIELRDTCYPQTTTLDCPENIGKRSHIREAT